jgi:hypothetical protein
MRAGSGTTELRDLREKLSRAFPAHTSALRAVRRGGLYLRIPSSHRSMTFCTPRASTLDSLEALRS